MFLQAFAAAMLAQAAPAPTTITPAAPAPAADQPPIRLVGEVNNWEIWDTAGSCSAVSYFGEHDVEVRVSYWPHLNRAYFWVGDRAWQSIREGGQYRVQIMFDNGSEYDVPDAEGSRRAESAPALMMRMNATQFLADFAAANAVGIFMGERRLGAFDLSGTGSVMGRLRHCAQDSLRRNPQDPFEGVAPSR